MEVDAAELDDTVSQWSLSPKQHVSDRSSPKSAVDDHLESEAQVGSKRKASSIVESSSGDYSVAQTKRPRVEAHISDAVALPNAGISVLKEGTPSSSKAKVGPTTPSKRLPKGKRRS